MKKFLKQYFSIKYCFFYLAGSKGFSRDNINLAYKSIEKNKNPGEIDGLQVKNVYNNMAKISCIKIMKNIAEKSRIWYNIFRIANERKKNVY